MPDTRSASTVRWATSALAASARAPLGLPLVSPFPAAGAVHRATLRFAPDAALPSGTVLLQPGSEHRALVRLGRSGLGLGGPDVLTMAVKVPDAYGEGADQDLLMATSGNGAPLHHVPLPSSGVADRLYSSLWLYAAGWRPVLFGVLPVTGAAEGPGLRLPFAVSGPVGRFRAVGELTLLDELPPDDAAQLSFSARHTGGGLRPLPPASLYRERG